MPLGDELTNVPCRRSIGRRRCRRDIIAQLDRSTGYIVWQCPLSGDHGVIHGWLEPRRHPASTAHRSAIDSDFGFCTENQNGMTM